MNNDDYDGTNLPLDKCLSCFQSEDYDHLPVNKGIIRRDAAVVEAVLGHLNHDHTWRRGQGCDSPCPGWKRIPTRCSPPGLSTPESIHCIIIRIIIILSSSWLITFVGGSPFSTSFASRHSWRVRQSDNDNDDDFKDGYPTMLMISKMTIRQCWGC